jgi:molybdopterin-guanine dinucleotide biosynthesis protein A
MLSAMDASRRVIPAYLLAGGRSSRFGSDKALATISGIPLLLRAAREMDAAGSPVTVIADRRGKYADLGLETIADDQSGLGPLGGLATALRHAQGAPGIIIAACDLHGWTADWIAELREAPADSAITLFGLDPMQPLLGRYAPRLLAMVQHRVDQGALSMYGLLNACRPVLLAPPPGAGPLCNINQQHDLPAEAPRAMQA